jgi:fibronectin type 3 domain-containing protein
VLADAEPKLEAAGETESREFVDADAEFGFRYRYVVIGLSGASQQSLPSDPVEIQPVDTFAPTVPSNLAAVAGVGSIDLSWSQNTEDDLAGYNVYRATADGPFARYAERVGVPAFTDSKVEAGQRYRYVVTAIDRTGNESGRSAETSAAIQ